MYSQVNAKFWCDEKLIHERADTKLVFLHLLTCQTRNILGCFPFSKALAIEETGISKSKYNAAFERLKTLGIIEFDEDSRMLLIVNYLKHNPIENENQVKGAITKLQDLPRTHLWNKVYKAYELHCKQSNEMLAAISELMEEHLEKQNECSQNSIPIADPELSNSNNNSNSNSDSNNNSNSDNCDASNNDDDNIINFDSFGTSEIAMKKITDVSMSHFKEYVEDCFASARYSIKSPDIVRIKKVFTDEIGCKMNLINAAVDEVRKTKPKYPVQYAIGCLKNWIEQGVTDQSEISAPRQLAILNNISLPAM